MLNSRIRTPLKIVTFISLLALPIFSVLMVVKAATTATTLSQAISAGSLNIAIVDAAGTPVPTPGVSFAGGTFSFNYQDRAGTLGTSTQKIRLDNPTGTVTWSVTMAATSGETAVWTDGGTNTYPYNNATSADNGRLTVNPATGTITPWGSCTNTNVTKGASDVFILTTMPSIDLMTAASGANAYCRWDLTGVTLTQRIPASQAVATYTIGMTITAL